jgi:hypothetical protein
MRLCLPLFLLLSVVLDAPAATSEELLDLLVLGVVPVDTLRIDATGVRGLAMGRNGVWVLVSEHTGRGVAEASYSSSILSWNPSTGEVKTLLRERDSFSTGLAFDGQALWAGGNRVGGLEAIYRIDPQSWTPDESIPSSGYHPGGLAWAGDYLWQVDSSARQVSRIETEEGKLSRRLQAAAFYPTGLAHDGVSIYCADAATGMVHRMRASSGRVDAVLDPEVLRFTGEFVTLYWHEGMLWTIRDTDDFVVRYQILS